MTLSLAFETTPGTGPILFVCDHASNFVPDDVNGGDLGLPKSEMARHIAWDIGAEGVARHLAEIFGAPAVYSRFSRLVIDPNRGEDDPTLVRKIYDGAVIPGNRHADAQEVTRRMNRFFHPYHDAIRQQLHQIETKGQTPILVSIHSFTPKLVGEATRPWHFGILWDRDARIAEPLIARLRAEPDLCIGDNEPYTGELEGDCMFQHGTSHNRPHVLIELRHDLIDDAEGQRAWAARLAPVLRRAIEDAGLI